MAARAALLLRGRDGRPDVSSLWAVRRRVRGDGLAVVLSGWLPADGASASFADGADDFAYGRAMSSAADEAAARADRILGVSYDAPEAPETTETERVKQDRDEWIARWSALESEHGRIEYKLKRAETALQELRKAAMDLLADVEIGFETQAKDKNDELAWVAVLSAKKLAKLRQVAEGPP